MKKLDKYILGKFIGTYFFAILLIVSIAVVFDITEKIDDFIEKEVPLTEIIFKYYLNFIPYFANLFSSLFTFIAVIFFTSKMSANSEITAILSSGVSFRRLMRPYMLGALIIASLSFILSNYIIPPANAVRIDFENTYIRYKYQNTDRNIHRQVRPGMYVYMRSFNVNNNVAYNLAIEKFNEEGELISKFNCDNARWDTLKNKWTAHNYFIREYNANGETVTNGYSIDTTIYIEPSDLNHRLNIIETMNLNRLNEYIDQQKLQGADNIEALLIEKYNRTSLPFSTFILTIIGLTLSSRKVRGGIGLNIGVGLALSFTYILFQRFSNEFAANGQVGPLLAVWIPNIVFTIVAGILYKMASK